MTPKPNFRNTLNRYISSVCSFYKEFTKRLNTPFFIKSIFITLVLILEGFFLLIFHKIFEKNFRSIEYCNFGLIISAFILASLALIDDFSGYIKVVLWKSILLKIVLILFACYLAYDCSRIKDDLNESLIAHQRLISDSLQNVNNAKFNKSLNDTLKLRTAEITNTFITALAQNGKEYIAGQKKVIDMVRDSARKVEQKVSPPEVYLDTIKVSIHAKDVKRLAFIFKNSKDEAINVKIEMYVAVVDNGIYVKEPKNETRPRVIDVAKLNDRQTFTYHFDFKPYSSFRTYCIYFEGGYYDKFGAYYPFNDFRLVDGINFNVSIPQGDRQEGLFGILKNLYPNIKTTPFLSLPAPMQKPTHKPKDLRNRKKG